MILREAHTPKKIRASEKSKLQKSKLTTSTQRRNSKAQTQTQSDWRNPKP
jgi:hypothetical protein